MIPSKDENGLAWNKLPHGVPVSACSNVSFHALLPPVLIESLQFCKQVCCAASEERVSPKLQYLLTASGK